MDKAGRKRIQDIAGALRTYQEELQQLAESEQEKYDNMGEGLQQSEQGQRIESAAEALDSSQSELDSIIDQLEGIE